MSGAFGPVPDAFPSSPSRAHCLQVAQVGSPVALLAPTEAEIAAVAASAGTTAAPAAAPAAAAPTPAPVAATPKPAGGGYISPNKMATPAAKKLAKSKGLKWQDIPGTGNFGRVTEDDVLIAAGEAPKAAPAPMAAPAPVAAAPAAAPVAAPPASGRIVASPFARSLAEGKGVDLATVIGTGPDGRIVAADVEKAALAKAAAPAGAAPVTIPKPAAPSGPAPAGVVPMTGMQKAVVRNMAWADNVPTYTVSRQIITDEFDALYAQLKPKVSHSHAVRAAARMQYSSGAHVSDCRPIIIDSIACALYTFISSSPHLSRLPPMMHRVSLSPLCLPRPLASPLPSTRSLTLTTWRTGSTTTPILMWRWRLLCRTVVSSPLSLRTLTPRTSTLLDAPGRSDVVPLSLTYRPSYGFMAALNNTLSQVRSPFLSSAVQDLVSRAMEGKLKPDEYSSGTSCCLLEASPHLIASNRSGKSVSLNPFHTLAPFMLTIHRMPSLRNIHHLQPGYVRRLDLRLDPPAEYRSYPRGRRFPADGSAPGVLELAPFSGHVLQLYVIGADAAHLSCSLSYSSRMEL